MRYRQALPMMLAGFTGAMWLTTVSCAKDSASPAVEAAATSTADPTVTASAYKEVTLEVLGMS